MPTTTPRSRRRNAVIGGPPIRTERPPGRSFPRRQPNQGGGRGGNGGVPSDPAYKILVDWLDQFGLATLARWAWNRYKDLGGSANSYQIIEIEMRDRQEFKDRFPAYEALAAQGNAMTPAQIIEYESTARSLLNRLGADSDYSNQEIQQFLIGGVSAAELSDRVSLAEQALTGPNEALDEIRRLYDIDDNVLAHFFLDPDRAMVRVERQWKAGQIAAASQIAGFGALNRAEASMLGERLSTEQATAGLGALVEQSGLFEQQVGETAGVSRQRQLEAISGNAFARKRIENRARQRQAQYEGGSGFATGRGGTVGLGDSSY